MIRTPDGRSPDAKTMAAIVAAVQAYIAGEAHDARRRLEDQLLKDARDYVDSCAARLASFELDLQVKPLIDFGDHLADYRRFLEELQVDLLVMNTKDEDQLAMHGLAYPLAVELRQIPLLML